MTNIETKKKTKTIVTIAKLQNKEELQKEIYQIADVKQLETSATKLAIIKQSFKDAHKKFKDILKEEKETIKFISSQIDELEKNIREKALSLVSTETTLKTNKETGEVTQKTSHNLPKKVFSYIPPKAETIVDTQEILANPEKYPQFVKKIITYKIDAEALFNAPAEEKPWIENKTKAKLSFKTKGVK